MKGLSCALFLLAVSLSPAEESAVPVAAPDYIRYLEDPGPADRLQTAVTRFSRGATVIDLVAVVHLGDKDYFSNLDQFLTGYDAVLYEMMGGAFSPEQASAEVDVDSGELGQIRGLQKMATSMLGLTFQLDQIDYSRENFVHADVDWDEYGDLMESRNQSFATIFTRAMSLAEDGEGEGIASNTSITSAMMGNFMKAITTGDSRELKRGLAPLMSEAEGFITQLEGDDGTVLVTERNKVVIREIEAKMAERSAGRYAVFYGAGHMPDLEARLLEKGFQKGRTAWFDAWTITDGAMSEADQIAGHPAPSPAEFLLKVIEANPEIVEMLQQLGEAAGSLEK